MLTSVQARKNQYRQQGEIQNLEIQPSKPRDGDYFGKYFEKMGPSTATAKIHDTFFQKDTLSRKIAVKAFPMKPQPEERDSLDVG